MSIFNFFRTSTETEKALKDLLEVEKAKRLKAEATLESLKKDLKPLQAFYKKEYRTEFKNSDRLSTEEFNKILESALPAEAEKQLHWAYKRMHKALEGGHHRAVVHKDRLNPVAREVLLEKGYELILGKSRFFNSEKELPAIFIVWGEEDDLSNLPKMEENV